MPNESYMKRTVNAHWRSGTRLWLGGVVSAFLLLGVLVSTTHLPAAATRGVSSTPSPATPALPAGLAPVLATTLAADAGDAYTPHPAAGSDVALSANNAAQHLTASFLPDGVHFCPTASCPNETGAWGMRLVGIGTASTLTTVAPIAPTEGRARVNYDHGNLTEWYINAPLGIEQGFTLTAPPARPTDAGDFVLSIGLDGVQATTTGDTVTLTGSTGKQWNYGAVTATDATGRVLPAQVHGDGDTLRIGVDDRGAVYPVVVDPLVQEVVLTAKDGTANAFFGVSVAMSTDGNTALVGAYGKNTAYIFVRTDASWTQQAALVAGDSVAFDQFGFAVALSANGNTALIGAPGRTNSKGAAYVFLRTGTTWAQQTTPLPLLATDGAALDQFGQSVALSADGNTALIGAQKKKVGLNDSEGAAYVFVRSGTTWTEQTAPSLLASDGTANENFGVSAALSADGNTALIGAFGRSGGGGAYVFVRTGTEWAQQTDPPLVASDAAANDRFGFSVALSADGNTALIGAFGRSGTKGGAYDFVRTGMTWAPLTPHTLTASDTAADDVFGVAVALSGDGNNGLIGADGRNKNTGAAYLFATPALHLTAIGAATAGSPVSLTISVTDPTGAAFFAFPDAVHFTSTDPHATLPPDFTFAPGDKGAHVLPNAATLTTAGNQRVIATDATLATVTASTPIVILPSTATTVTANTGATPQSALLDTAFAKPLSVTATDAFGNAVGDATVTFEAPASGPGGTFPGPATTATAVTNASGVATAPTFTANGTAGSYTVTASAPGTTMASFALTNTTTTPSTSSGLQFFPLPQPVRLLDTRPGQTAVVHPGTVRPNAFTVGLGSDGKFNLLSNTGGNFIIDLTGYYAPPGTGGLFFHPLPQPVRLLDTRPGQTAFKATGAALTPGQTLNLPGQFTAAGVTIPSSAKALAGNATVDNTANAPAGFATLFPGGTTQPPTSNLNFAPGTVAPNAFTVGLGGDGTFNLFSNTGGNFLLDVTGYYDTVSAGGLLFFPLSQPVRELDTRAGQSASIHPGVPLTAKGTLNLPGSFTFSGVTVPADAKALVGNATVDNSINAPDGFATLFPGGTSLPLASNLNYGKGTVAPNAFIVGVGTDGTYNLFSLSGGNFIIDISGYFATGTGTNAVPTKT